MTYCAQVNAPGEPRQHYFSCYEQFHAVMDGLGHWWELLCETPDPREYGMDEARVWEKQLAEISELISQPQPITNIPTTWLFPGLAR